ITAITATQLTLQIMPSFSPSLAGQDVNVRWFQRNENIITLCEATL
ncbi:MAG: enterobactin synthase subunit EntD, partial [Citrobacter sp.]